MNKVILIGRLTKEPEIRWSQSANSICIATYNLAVDRQYKKEGEQQADFPRCKCFGKTAEFAQQYLHKGTKIAVEGRLTTGSYTNGEGQTIYTTEVTVDRHEFVERKSDDQRGTQQSRTHEADTTFGHVEPQARPTGYTEYAAQDQSGFASLDSDFGILDDDGSLPF